MLSRINMRFKVSPSLHIKALKLHITLATIFGLPLFVVIFTGAILATIPLLRDYPGPPPIEKLEQSLKILEHRQPYQFLLLRNDLGQGRAVTLSAKGMQMEHIDLYTGQVIEMPWIEKAYLVMRQIHVNFMMDMRWLVELSTWFLLLIVLSGTSILTRYRFRNTVIGWHYGLAIALSIPVIVISVSGIVIVQKHRAMEKNPPPIIAQTRDIKRVSTNTLNIESLFEVLYQHDVESISSIQKLPSSTIVNFIDKMGQPKKYDGQTITEIEQNREIPWGDIHLGRWLGLPMVAAYAVTMYLLLFSMVMAYSHLIKKKFKRVTAKWRRKSKPLVSL